ncbi:MAG TPA: polyphosphate kinase 1 [Planctomycetaceae bacterium]|nr:polyphosphate kinase 1 [Planctomycetaceae bacterium]
MTEPRFFNRELSWLEFNQRVLNEARDPALPLLERLKFLAITASNLDEFVSVRIGSLQWQIADGDATRDSAGLTPQEQLRAVLARIRQFVADQYTCLLDELRPALDAAGIRQLEADELNDQQARIAGSLFLDEIYPVLSPMAVDDAGDFPLLANLTLHLAVRLAGSDAQGPSRYAVIPLGRSVPRLVSLPSDAGQAYLLLEDLVSRELQRFFPGITVLEAVPFRITRNADLELQEDLSSDLVAEMQEVLEARKSSASIRLQVASRASSELRQFLQRRLDVPDELVFDIPGPLDLSGFMRVADWPGFDALKYEPFPPVPNPQIDPATSMFETIASRDVLLYHPYDSYDPVVRFVDEAADDPDVLAIKQTLYRTSARSPIVAALRRAAQRGKYVTAVVELRARFDEARNIEWANDLERNGVQVIYGVKGLKTHAKICLVVRREATGLVRYTHFGTGNYNEQTARLYSDASLMTCDHELGADATNFFHALTGYSQPQQFRKIEAAPIGLRERLLEMIEAEINYRHLGRKAQIILKLNSLVDPAMIESLYLASQAGVKIRLNIRGICCLRPGVPGLSENITVTSVIDRFLEHSRILYFHHGGDERLFISSADWMTRNLDRRVELLVPVEQPAAKVRLLTILKLHLQDSVKARRLLPDGSYAKVEPARHREPLHSQAELYRRAKAAHDDAERQPVEVFEPHRAQGQEP